MTARIGIVLFPGSNRDIDAVNAVTLAGDTLKLAMP